MMSIGSIAGGGAGYYADKDNYYFLGNLDSRWMGEGAKALGLEGNVNEQVLDALIAGRLPNGESLERIESGINTHRSGYDLTFSAPKSVSIMVVVNGDERLLAAHNLAVDTVAKEIESLVATRVMIDGVNQHINTAKMVAALFNHDTSRELDPQLHTHLLLLNATEHEGKWRTLSSDTVNKSGVIETIYANQIALAQIYRHVLRQEVEARGFETVEVGKHGLWEIQGVPTADLSRRSQQIREAVGEDASPKSRDVAALDTRLAKQHNPDQDALLTRWHATLDKAGFDYKSFREQADARAASYQAPSAKTADALTAEVSTAVTQAISLLSDNKTQFTYSEVLSKTLAGMQIEPGSMAQARAGIEAAISTQQLIPLDDKKGLFTSSIHLLDELSVQQLAGRIQHENRVLSFSAPDMRLSGVMATLSDTAPTLAIVNNRGGADAQREQVEATVSMAMGQGRAVTVLATDRTGERFLAESPILSERMMNRAALKADLSLAANSTLVIANAEKLSVKETLLILEQSLRNNVQMLMMDSAGRKGTGNALATLEEAGVTRFNPSDKPTQQVDVSIVSVPDKQARYAQLAAQYADLSSGPVPVLAQVSGEREQRALAGAIRDELRTRGELGDTQTSITSLVPVWTDAKSRRQMDTYREGQVMEHWNGDTRKLERYTVERVTPQSRTVTLQDGQGNLSPIKVGEFDSSWRLYNTKSIDIAVGEKLTWLGKQDKLTARDTVTVLKVKKDRLVVEREGKKHTVSLTDGIKATHGYVSAPGSRMRDNGIVLGALAIRDTNAPMFNELARGGDTVVVYTALPEREADVRLSSSPLYRQARQQVSPDGQPLDKAMDLARDSLLSVTEKAVRQAISVTQGSEVTFKRLDVMNRALPMHPSLTPDRVNVELDRQIKAGELLTVNTPYGKANQLYVPATSYVMEKQILQTIAEGKFSASPLMPNADATLFNGLTTGQQAASRLILESTDRFVGIQGYAGVGKTTQFKAVLTALDTLPDGQRPEVIGLAPTHRAVGEMASVGVKAQTIASFLMDVERRLHSGETVDYSRTLFLIDESSMVGNRDMAETLSRIATAGGRAVLSGDTQQLLPVANGAPFSLMQQRSALDTAIMNDIVRQTPELRPAVEAIIQRKIGTALNIIESVTPAQVPRDIDATVPSSSVVQIAQTKEQREAHGDLLIKAMVEDFTGRTPAARLQTLIVTQTNQDAQNLNAGIHHALHAAGKLGEAEQHVSTLIRAKTHEDSLKSVAGLGKYSGHTALINQHYYTVHSPHHQDGVVFLRDAQGKDHLLSAFESSLRDIALFSHQNITLSQGDVVRFTRDDRERGRNTQVLWEVKSVSDNGNITLSHHGDTRIINPTQDPNDRHIDYGYAGTAHKAQGASAPYVMLLAGVSGARRSLAKLSDAYVGLSRMKEHVQVYTDDLGKWMSLVTKADARATAHDVLHHADDRQASTGETLWRTAKTLNATPLGRALQRETGLSPDGEARFISGSTKYPTPHVAWPAYDANGRQRGVWLDEIKLNEEGRIAGLKGEGRMLGSDNAAIIVLQRSQNGEVKMTATLQEALQHAQQHPESGVVLQRHTDVPDWVVEKLSGGQLPREVPTATTQQAHASDIPDPINLKTPEERAQALAEREAIQRQEKQHTNPAKPEDRELERAIKETSAQLQQEKQHEQRELQHQVARDIATEKQQQRQENREQLQQLEREIVKEKTLGGD